MSSKAIQSLSPLAADLRTNDPDRFAATLFAPSASRESLIALYAFDHELARLRSLVREPMAGLIRLQWWEDIIDGIDSQGAINHPVVRALHRAVTKDGLDVTHLKRAIDGRRRPFENDQPFDLPMFERFLVDIGGSITCAASVLLGRDDEKTLAVADRIGLVRAAWEQLSLLGRSIADQKPWLPAVWLEAGDEGPGHRLGGVASQSFTGWALAALAEARRRREPVERSILPALFPGTLAGVRLRDPLRRVQQPTLPGAAPTLIWHWIRGRF